MFGRILNHRSNDNDIDDDHDDDDDSHELTLGNVHPTR